MKMKITYLGNHNPFELNTEKKVVKAFRQLGHTVDQVDERNWNIYDLIKRTRVSDLFLFHKGIRFGKSLGDLVDLLSHVPCKKALWYFDYVWQERERFMEIVAPLVDYGFMTDGSFVKRNSYDNLITLRQGCEKQKKGKKKKKYEYDIVFTGSIYGSREILVNGLKKNYGDRFKYFDNVFGREFYNLCASAKIMIAPKFPSNDFYWSNRIYETLGAGGFLIHPKCEGLKEEYEEYKHFVPYVDGDHLKYLIDYYLEHPEEREQIRKAGQKHTLKNYTYKHRVKKLLEYV